MRNGKHVNYQRAGSLDKKPCPGESQYAPQQHHGDTEGGATSMLMSQGNGELSVISLRDFQEGHLELT